MIGVTATTLRCPLPDPSLTPLFSSGYLGLMGTRRGCRGEDGGGGLTLSPSLVCRHGYWCCGAGAGAGARTLWAAAGAAAAVATRWRWWRLVRRTTRLAVEEISASASGLPQHPNWLAATRGERIDRSILSPDKQDDRRSRANRPYQGKTKVVAVICRGTCVRHPRICGELRATSRCQRNMTPIPST